MFTLRLAIKNALLPTVITSMTMSVNPGLQDIQPLDMGKPDSVNPEPNQDEPYDCESGGDNDNEKDDDCNSASDGAMDESASNQNPCSDEPAAPSPGDANFDDDVPVPPADPDGNGAGGEGEALSIHSNKKRRLSLGDGVKGAGAGVGVPRTKVHKSPSILIPISPFPACTIRLNANDHRFSAVWKSHIECDQWLDELALKSHSISFDARSEADWRSKLRQVHERCWVKWELGSHLPDLRLANGIEKPIPGRIPEHVFVGLKPHIDDLGPKKMYTKA